MLSDPNDESPANIDAAVSNVCVAYIPLPSPDLYSSMRSGDVAERQGRLQEESQEHRAAISGGHVTQRREAARQTALYRKLRTVYLGNDSLRDVGLVW